MTRTYNAITSDERKIALNTLRAAMLSLKPTGATGFEGLLAKILSDFLNQPVRLFKSGYQFGQDAATSSPDTILSIEGKRYSDSISDGTLLEKLPQLMDQENSPHLWLAGVTSETNPRLEKTVRSFSEQTGIACFILDWPALSESPPLVAYCMLEPNALREFLQEHAKTDDDQSAIAAAIDTLSRCDTLCAASKELSAELTAPSIGLALAKQGNALWLQEKLSSQEQARAAFGQRLAPAATSALPLQNRAQLEANIIHRVFSTGPGAPVFVVGKQGFGKSWAVVNAWSNAPEPPLLLVLTANNAADLEKATDISDALAREFLVQTGEIFPELGLPRWKRRFARWRRHPSPETARFVILLDGLNQRADAGWTKILSALQDFAVRTGGQLAITVRPPLYKRLKNLVPEHRSPIEVPDWSKRELRDILSIAKISADELSPSVIRVLRVPRLCAIAFELLAKEQIKDFRDLTVSKLLLTQIQSGEATSLDPSDFARDIAKHADDTLERIRSQHPDPTLFEPKDTERVAIHNRLQLLSQDGFFEIDPASKSDYDILPDTLSLGLALSLLRQIQRGARGDTPLEALCADLLEPIEAVDQTAEIVLDALILAASDEDCTDKVVEALIHAFTSLQNIDVDLQPPFAFAARRRPRALLSALETAAKRGSGDPNIDWLTSSAASFSTEPEARSFLESAIKNWLNVYSLDPKLGAVGRTPNGPTTEEIEKQTAGIEAEIAAFSAYETSMLGEMSRDDAETSYDLIEIAITLLKTLDRTPFVPHMVRYVFARILNSPWHHSGDDFNALMRFNYRDWSLARNAVIEQVDAIEAASPSMTGKWTIIVMLEATGDPSDCARAKKLRSELEDEDFKKLRAEIAKRRVYAPFAPNEPLDAEHLEKVRDQLDEIDLKEWRLDRGNTTYNHIIQENLPYLARFAANEAIAFQRRLIDEMLTRSDLPLKMAVFQLQSEWFVATDAQRDEMISKSLSLPVNYETKADDENWLAQQLLLLMGLAELDGNQQLEIISELPGAATLLLKFDDVMRQANASLVALKLSEAIEKGPSNRIVRTLLFAKALGEVSSNSLTLNLQALLNHENTIVRAFTMRALVSLNNLELIQRFAETGWSARSLHPKNEHYERWYGEQLLITATQTGSLEIPDLIARITPKQFARATHEIGDKVTPYICDVLDKAFELRLDEKEEEPPIIKAGFNSPTDLDPELVSLRERETTPPDPLNMLSDFSEIDKQFREQQRARSIAYSEFFDTMTEQHAEDLLSDIGYSTIQACVDLAPKTVVGWADQVIESTGWTRRVLKPIGLHIARAISEIAPEVSCQLFAKLLKTDGFVRHHLGTAQIEYDAVALWFSADIEQVAQACFDRLDNCANDESLQVEVLSALHANRSDLLRIYYRRRMESDHPMKVCRALLVGATANLGQKDFNRYIDTPGPIGIAAKKAAEISQRGDAMMHWWRRLCEATSAETFWQASIMLKQCLDARFDLLEATIEEGTIADRFFPFLDQDIKNAIERNSKTLSKTLFGDRLSRSWFVQLPQANEEPSLQ